MNNTEITNLIIKHFMNRGIETKIDLFANYNVDNGISPVVVLSLELDKKYTDNFSFFYSIKDTTIYFESNNRFDENYDKGIIQEFLKADKVSLDIFNFFSRPDKDKNIIHLSWSIRISMFNELLLIRITNYFTYPNELINEVAKGIHKYQNKIQIKGG